LIAPLPRGRLISRRALLGAGGAAALVRGARADDAMDVRSYDARGDHSRDDAPALRRAFAAALAARRPLYLPAGRYRLDTPIDWDIGALARVGISVFGDGPLLSALDFVSAGDGPDLLLHCSAADRASFYSQLHDFGVQGHGSGPVLQIGRDDFSDAHNGIRLERMVINADGGGPALTLNSVCNAHVDVVANAGGVKRGIALRLCQTALSTFSGAQGHASVGTWMGDGYNFGNVFTAIDYEVLGTGVSIAGVNCARNTWIGGTLANLDWGFDCTAGHDNRAININPAITGRQLVRNGVGLRME
jgi:hypothetical protein